MMNAEYYDLNVWSDESNSLMLTAYEWELTPEGDSLQMNSSVYYSKTFTELAEIEFLLGDLYLNHYPFTDYDEWRDLSEVYNDHTPESIKLWLEALPAYEVPKIALEA
jgi:hypothetical protein